MLVPGGNLFDEATDLIETSTVTYYRDLGRQVNSVGEWVTAYAEGIDIEASVQAPDRNTYVQFGLDMQRNYLTVFIPNDTTDLSRDRSGDQFVIEGYRYQLESEVPWFPYDGWVQVTVVQIRKEP